MTPPAAREDSTAALPVVDHAADGTQLYAPRGELLEEVDGSAIECHLCGGWLRKLGSSHLLPRRRDRTRARPAALPGARELHAGGGSHGAG
jgi:hypothetical protein